ncbi:MAG: signal peptide peptidase SppA [Acidobacteriota bacterium]|jgi:protease-4|nr:signal peptide peptidase SppA [Acidobacteriota bacterium]
MAQKQSNLWLWLVVGMGVFVFFILCLAALAMMFAEDGSSHVSLSSNQVASLEITGTITDSKAFVDELNDYGKRSGVKAVLIRIDSPGGGVAASQEIYEAIKKFRKETKKKVVVSMASTAASGGYYIACGADKIFANPGTVTGSIGVIAQWYDYSDLLHWAKMQSVVIKSGELKDSGSGSRPVTEEERVYFQTLIDDMYSQFVIAVADGRNMPEEEVRKLADGRVYTGLQAKEHNLIDELGTFQDAVGEAARLGGIEGEPKLLTPLKKRFSTLEMLLGNAEAILPLGSVNGSESHIRFEYLWR